MCSIRNRLNFRFPDTNLLMKCLAVELRKHKVRSNKHCWEWQNCISQTHIRSSRCSYRFLSQSYSRSSIPYGLHCSSLRNARAMQFLHFLDDEPVFDEHLKILQLLWTSLLFHYICCHSSMQMYVLIFNAFSSSFCIMRLLTLLDRGCSKMYTILIVWTTM